MAFGKKEQRGKQVQTDPITCETIDLWLGVVLTYTEWNCVGLERVLHFFPEAETRDPLVGQ